MAPTAPPQLVAWVGTVLHHGLFEPPRLLYFGTKALFSTMQRTKVLSQHSDLPPTPWAARRGTRLGQRIELHLSIT